MTEITANGFTLTRLDERIEELNALFRSIYGNDLDLSLNTPDGQLIGVFAEAIAKVDLLALGLYQQLDPSLAKGVGLSRLVALNGLRRLAGTASQATLTFTGTPGAFIPAGSLYRGTVTGDTFSTLTDAVIPVSGTVNTQALCTKLGAVQAPANTITEKVTVVYGVTTVTNLTPALVGRAEETDEELRLRQTSSTATPGQALFDSLQGYLSNLSGVTQCRVYENRDGSADSNGQAPHSIHVVIVGGNEGDIVTSIWKKISNGCTLVGNTEVLYTDTKGTPQFIRYTRPSELPVYCKIQVKIKAGFPANGVAQLKEALVAWGLANQRIGEDVLRSRLYDPLNDVKGHSVVGFFISYNPLPTTEVDLPVLYAELATFDISNVEVEIVP